MTLSKISTQSWLVKFDKDAGAAGAWWAKRGKVKIDGATEADLREKLRLHILAELTDHPAAKARIKRVWTINVFDEEDGAEEENDCVFDLFD